MKSAKELIEDFRGSRAGPSFHRAPPQKMIGGREGADYQIGSTWQVLEDLTKGKVRLDKGDTLRLEALKNRTAVFVVVKGNDKGATFRLSGYDLEVKVTRIR